MAMTMAEHIAAWASGPAIEALPRQGRDLIKNAFLDTLAVTVLGARQSAPRLLARLEFAGGARGAASVCAMGRKTDLRCAALINGTSAHADLFDDNNAPMIAHPSSPLVSALLPLAQVRGASGESVMQAYGAGFEVGVGLGRALNPALYERGWHVTRVLGLIAATVACCRLLALAPAQMIAAMGIAVSMAGGVRQNFGTMTMALHVGLTARDALHAALLAESGFTSDRHALEGRYGLFAAFSGCSPALPLLGEPFELLTSGIIFKPYPSGAPTHAAVDATLAVLRHPGFEKERIVRITCLVHPWNAMTLRDEVPQDSLQAKVSMRYCIAAAMLHGDLAPARFSGEAVAEPALHALMRKVDIRISDQFQGSEEFPAEIQVETDDGRIWSEIREVPPGGSTRPLSRLDLIEKFRACVHGTLSPSVVDSVVDLILGMDGLEDVDALCGMLEGSAAGRGESSHQ